MESLSHWFLFVSLLLLRFSNLGLIIETYSPKVISKEKAFASPNSVSGIIEIDVPTNSENPLDFIDKPEISISFWGNFEEILGQANIFNWEDTIKFRAIDHEGDNYEVIFSLLSKEKKEIKCPNVSYDGWHLITATYGNGYTNLYLDGKLCESVAQEGNLNRKYSYYLPYTRLKINDIPYSYMVGRVDELKIWNYSLNESEVLEEYNFLNKNTNGLVGYYKFDGNLKDDSGNNNHGNVSHGNVRIDKGIKGECYRFGMKSNPSDNAIGTLTMRNDFFLTKSTRLNYFLCLVGKRYDKPFYQGGNYFIFVDGMYFDYHSSDVLKIRPGEVKKVEIVPWIRVDESLTSDWVNELALFNKKDTKSSLNFIESLY